MARTASGSDQIEAAKAKLGFLLGAFKDRIEGEIVKNLDALIKQAPTARKAAAKKKV